MKKGDVVVIDILRIKKNNNVIVELDFDFKVNRDSVNVKKSKVDLITWIEIYEKESKKEDYHFIVKTTKGKPVKVVADKYLRTDSNKDEKDNLGELPEYN